MEFPITYDGEGTVLPPKNVIGVANHFLIGLKACMPHTLN